MTDLEQQLCDHLHRKAAIATPRYDLEAVEEGLTLIALSDPHERRRPRPAVRLVVGIAAAVAVIAGIGVIARSAGRDDTIRPADTTSTQLPVMPGSEQGTRLLADCIRGLGLDVQFDDSSGTPGIAYDNGIVTDDAFRAANDTCTDQLVRSRRIYGLGPDAPSGPGIAVAPGSAEGSRLLGECVVAAGLEVSYGGRSITYDNRVVSDQAFRATYDTCLDQLVAAGKLIPLGR